MILVLFLLSHGSTICSLVDSDRRPRTDGRDRWMDGWDRWSWSSVALDAMRRRVSPFDGEYGWWLIGFLCDVGCRTMMLRKYVNRANIKIWIVIVESIIFARHVTLRGLSGCCCYWRWWEISPAVVVEKRGKSHGRFRPDSHSWYYKWLMSSQQERHFMFWRKHHTPRNREEGE